MTFTTTSTPSDLAFDISLYTAQSLVLAAQESKRVCREMERREEIRLNEIADRLFHSDDDDASGMVHVARPSVDACGGGKKTYNGSIVNTKNNYERSDSDSESRTIAKKKAAKTGRNSMISFEDRLEELRKYKRMYGHCNPAVKYPSLGQWCCSIRSDYHKIGTGKRVANKKLLAKDVQQLEAIGSKWELGRSK
jgi:hypothetical protein